MQKNAFQKVCPLKTVRKTSLGDEQFFCDNLLSA
jgi:hypothetical protein